MLSSMRMNWALRSSGDIRDQVSKLSEFAPAFLCFERPIFLFLGKRGGVNFLQNFINDVQSP